MSNTKEKKLKLSHRKIIFAGDSGIETLYATEISIGRDSLHVGALTEKDRDRLVGRALGEHMAKEPKINQG